MFNNVLIEIFIHVFYRPDQVSYLLLGSKPGLICLLRFVTYSFALKNSRKMHVVKNISVVFSKEISKKCMCFQLSHQLVEII